MELSGGGHARITCESFVALLLHLFSHSTDIIFVSDTSSQLIAAICTEFNLSTLRLVIRKPKTEPDEILYFIYKTIDKTLTKCDRSGKTQLGDAGENIAPFAFVNKQFGKTMSIPGATYVFDQRKLSDFRRKFLRQTFDMHVMQHT
jgi:hypothetical protein